MNLILLFVKDVLVEAINLETPFSNSINPDNNTFRFSIASRYGRYVVNNNEIDENQIIFKFLHNPNGSSRILPVLLIKDERIWDYASYRKILSSVFRVMMNLIQF